MNILIKTIQHKEQAYETPGDWRFDAEGNLNIFVSDLGNWKYEVLIAIHELIEVTLCKDREITLEEVDAFDINFEKERKEQNLSKDLEAGDSKDAPYRKEHFFATSLERLVAAELNVDWEAYDESVTSLL